MKTEYVVGAVAVILIALVAWFFVSKNTSSLPSTAATQQESQEMSSGSLAALAARGGSWKCDVSQTSGTDSTNGTVYVSGGKVRGDFTSKTASAGAVESHMISDGASVYVWSSMMPTGIKMKATQNAPTDQPQGSQQDFYNQNYDYKCAAWTEDSAQFTLPTGITFNDMSGMMPGAAANGSADVKAGQTPGMDCSMCDQAPSAEAKAACKAALHC